MNKRRKAQKRLARRPSRKVAPRPEGRPPKYSVELCQLAMTAYFEGKSDEAVAAALGVHVRTVWTWLKDHAEFRQCREDAKLLLAERVKSAMLARALGATIPKVDIRVVDGKLEVTNYVEKLPGDVGAQKYLLNNLNPKEFREKMDTTVSNPDGSNLIPDDLVDAASRIARERLQAERDMGLKKQRRTSEDE